MNNILSWLLFVDEKPTNLYQGVMGTSFWIDLIANLAITVSYFLIPMGVMYWLYRKKPDTNKGVAWLFSIFLLVWGIHRVTHIIAFYFHFAYFETVTDVITGVVSVLTAVVVWRTLPRVFNLIGPHEVELKNRLIAELQEDERRKDEFISMASHELKTPITSLKMLIQLSFNSLSENSPEKVGPLLLKADVQLVRLTRLINDMLDISKSKAGKLEITKETVNFDEFIREVVQGIDGGDHQLVLVGKTDKKIAIDQGRIAQVVQNLVNNAVKYSPGEKEVKIIVRTVTGRVLIIVKDQGIGIPEKLKRQIFRPFYRIEDQSKGSFSGLGLGLYISAQIVKLHQGKIWVESKKGQGSEFYVVLPL